MLFREIVDRIDMLRTAPIFYRERLSCATVTYLKPMSKKERGIYLPECETEAFYKNAKSNNPIEFEHMRSIIEGICECNEYTYSLFNVLHELGHWTHYCQYRERGYSDCDYVAAFEADRIKLYAQRSAEANLLDNDTIEEFNHKYSKLYCELCTEREANRFAARHLADYLII